jgi:hypothetical protein
MSTAAKAMQVTPPAEGEKITISNGKLRVPDRPVIPAPARTSGARAYACSMRR